MLKNILLIFKTFTLLFQLYLRNIKKHVGCIKKLYIFAHSLVRFCD
jgi:hypothetical protein